jgi:hypothetical protein
VQEEMEGARPRSNPPQPGIGVARPRADWWHTMSDLEVGARRRRSQRWSRVGGKRGRCSVLGLEIVNWWWCDTWGRTMGGREGDSRVGGAVAATKSRKG